MAHFGKEVEEFSGSRYVHIKSAEQTDSFTVYVIAVTVGPYTWTVRHRYSEFYDLHEKLTSSYKLDKSLLPPKKVFGNQTESFVKKRQKELEIYLQTILLYLAQHVPHCLAYFLDFDQYEIHGVTQSMAEDLYNRGEGLLQSKDKYTVTTLQLYSLTERLKLPEPTCDSGDVKKDLGHILDFITRSKHLKIVATSDVFGDSNIVLNKLPYDLTLFKSLQILELIGPNFLLISGLETVKQTVQQLIIYESCSSMKEIFLQDSLHWKADDGSVLVGSWDRVTYLSLNNNGLATIHPSIQLVPNVETLDLSYNEIEVIENLQWLSQLTYLDLSHNRIRRLDSLHTKLGNLKIFLLANNELDSLHGFAKLFSLQTLDISNNKISSIEEVEYISQLPCLENVQMVGNSVTSTLDYRTKTLALFGDRVAEVILDHEMPNQKELDTVAVLQALRKAKTVKITKKLIPKKNASAVSLTDMYGRSPAKSLSDQLEESAIASASGNVSQSVPSAVHWPTRDFSSARSQSPFSLDSNSSYNSAIDSEGVLEKPEAPSLPAGGMMSSCLEESGDGCDGNSNNSHQLIPEAHPFDLSFEHSRETKLVKPVKTAAVSDHLHRAQGLRRGSRECTEASEIRRETGSATGDGERKDSCDSDSKTGLLPDPNLGHKRTMTSIYNTADLPTATNIPFVRWLEQQLLNHTQDHDLPASDSQNSGTIIRDVVWCWAEQMSQSGVLVPCCAILTSSTVFIEQLGDCASGFPGVPQLIPLFILSLKNIQEVVIGPSHSYFRLEEAFVGKPGVFTLYGVDNCSIRRFITNVISSCQAIGPSQEMDCIDLNAQSELLKQIISHEEKLPGLASDRLVAVIPICLEENEVQNFLILSENRIYCIGLSCVLCPPPSFQSSVDHLYSLDIVHEFSIFDKILDMTVNPSLAPTTADDRLNQSPFLVAFQMYQLSVNVSVSKNEWPMDVSGSQRLESKRYRYLFPSSAYRDLFLDRLSNLRSEHENCMCPIEREEPEGGNDQVPPTLCHNLTVIDTKSLIQKGVPSSLPPLSILSDENNSIPYSTAQRSGSDSLPSSPTGVSQDRESLRSCVSPSHSESNESFRSVLTDNEIFKEPVEYQGAASGADASYSTSPKGEDLSVSPMSNFSRASISPPPGARKTNPAIKEEANLPSHRDTWQQEQPAASKADSLPSSFDWKGFYFRSPLRPNIVDDIDLEQSIIATASTDSIHRSATDFSQHKPDSRKSFNSSLFLDLKYAIKKSGSNESVSKTDYIGKYVPIESEHDKFLKQCVQSYDLINTLPAKLKPLCLMNGAELRKFFHSTVSQYSTQEGLEEELHYVLWSTVIPYSNPSQEIITLVMLSTYAVYLVSNTDVKVAQSSRPSWMTHSRNQSDSAISWKTDGNPPNSPNRKHVKAFGVMKYQDLYQVNIGLFDQCIRLTGLNENSVFTVATRDCQVTEQLIQKLKLVLSLSISSPVLERSSHDLEQDFYRVRSQSKITLEGLVYTHPSKVNFVYPADETVNDLLYLVKEKISAAVSQNTLSLSLWFYMQCYLLPTDDSSSPASSLHSTSGRPRSVIITPLYFALAVEDLVTFPLPDFVRGLPENPWHEVVECRPIENLKSVRNYSANPHWLTLTFADETADVVVDTSLQHFSQPQGERGRQRVAPEVSFKLFVQSVKERTRLISVLEKLWKQQVAVVGRMLDVHTV